MVMIVYTISRKQIKLNSTPLAVAGGEGSVHCINFSSDYLNCCAKIYHPLKRTSSKKNKLEFMVRNRPSYLSRTEYMFCWPNEIIFDESNKFIGYIMPLAFSGSEQLFKLTNTTLPQNLNNNWRKFERT